MKRTCLLPLAFLVCSAAVTVVSFAGGAQLPAAAAGGVTGERCSSGDAAGQNPWHSADPDALFVPGASDRFEQMLGERVSRRLMRTPLKKKGGENPKIIKVDCTKHGSGINRALENPAEELTIEIQGMCEEDVEIRRDHVTLRGTDPARDGIRAEGDGGFLYGAVVLVLRGYDVRFENLTITGGRFTGLMVEQAPFVFALNCRFEGNSRFGAYLEDSWFQSEDSSFTGNGEAGACASAGGYLVCRRCTAKDNPAPGEGVGIRAGEHSWASVENSELGGAYAAEAEVFGIMFVSDSTIDGKVEAGLHAEMGLMDLSLTGAIEAFYHSLVTLSRVTQNPHTGENAFNGESTLTINHSTLAGTTSLFNFSQAVIAGDGSQVENLNCFRAGDAVCNDPAASVTGTSNCSLCFKP